MQFQRIYCVAKKTEYQYYHQTNAGRIDFKKLNIRIQKNIWNSHKNHTDFLTKFLKIVKNNHLAVKIIPADSMQNIIDDSRILIISCGGDGTFLSCAQNFPKAFLLGMNSDRRIKGGGSKGALTFIHSGNIEKYIPKMLAGHFTIEHWSKLSVTINNRKISRYAINEIYVGNPISYVTTNISLKVGKYKDDFNCSGFIACTSIGSHAWFNAAGGKSFSGDTQSVGYVVLLPSKKWQFKSISEVLKPKEKITLTPHRNGYIISFDSKTNTISLKAGDKIKIFLATTNPLKILRPI